MQEQVELPRVAYESCIAEMAGACLASARGVIRATDGLSVEDATPVTARWIAELRATPEVREGMSAFLDERRPNWIGRGGDP